MEVAETTVATMVEIPASTKTGNGRDEPEPEPSFGRVKNMLTEGPSLRARNTSDEVESVKSLRGAAVQDVPEVVPAVTVGSREHWPGWWRRRRQTLSGEVETPPRWKIM